MKIYSMIMPPFYPCIYTKNICLCSMYKYTIKLDISSRLNKEVIIIKENNSIEAIYYKIFVDRLVT